MGRTSSTRSEKDVLKLVHPGKRIETYTKPISAAELLKKYPKYCITRPDVFEFPWIVVKPDSVLVPGKVFFLVPKRTLYRLLKTRQQQDLSQPPPLLRLSSEIHSHPLPGPSSPSTANAGMTPKHQGHHPRRQKPMYQNREKPQEQDGGRRSRKQSQIESWPLQLIGSNRSVRYYSSHVHDCYKCGNVASVEVSREDFGNGNGGAGKKETTTLKSCMRKPGRAPRLVNPRVRFSIPGEDIVEPVTKQRTVIASLSRLATSLIVDVCR